MPDTLHENLLTIGKELGYLPSVLQGICRGFTLKWLEAVFLDEEVLFLQRIIRFQENPPTRALINSVQEKVKNRVPLTEDDLNMLDIMAFYENVTLYSTPDTHHNLYNQSLVQRDLDRISEFASSDRIKELGGLTTIYSQPGIYTEKETIVFLNNIAQAIKSVYGQTKAKIGLSLTSVNHNICLTYDAEQDHFVWMDINHFPPRVWPNLDNIAKLISLSFYGDSTLVHPLVFETEIIATKDDPKLTEMVTVLNTLGTRHVITHDMLHRQRIEELVFMAAQNGHADSIAELARWGLNLNAGLHDTNMHNSFRGVTPIFIAVQHGHLNVITELMKHSVDLNATYYDLRYLKTDRALPKNFTLAHVAAQSGHAHVLAELVKLGCCTQSRLNDGATPAYLAAEQGHAEAIEELANHDVFMMNVPNNQGLTPAHIAAQNNHANVITVLARLGVKLNTLDKQGKTPVHLAVESGYIQIIIALGKHDPSLLNELDEAGNTPAYIAAKNGNAEMIAVLADYGVDLNAPLNNSGTLAGIAVERGDAIVLAELGRRGVDFNAHDQKLAYKAVTFGHPHLLALLKKFGTDLNIKSHGQTAVFCAMGLSDIMALAHLAKYGADLTIPNKRGKTPVDVAKGCFLKYIQFLMNNQSDSTTSFMLELGELDEFLYLFKDEGIQERLRHFASVALKDNTQATSISFLPEELESIIFKNNTTSIFKNNLSSFLKSSVAAARDEDNPDVSASSGINAS